MAPDHHAPITVPVADLHSSCSFYLSALRPLGYQYISHVNHRTPSSSSQAIGLGPANTSRVDIFLSQSNNPRNLKSAHLIFPAASAVAVREFYAAALNAGGRLVSSPKTINPAHPQFAATVEDLDYNQIEVCFANPTSYLSDSRSPPRTGATILKWRDGVRDQIPSSSPPTYPQRQQVQTSLQPGSNSSSPRSRAATAVRSPEANTGKALVGTLLGAAAGVAAVYAFSKELEDSKAKEDLFVERMEARRRVKAEAKARAIATEWRKKTSRSSRRSPINDRDSGYASRHYSPPSKRRDSSPPVRRYRTISYPEADLDIRRRSDSRSRNGSREIKVIESRPLEYSSRSGTKATRSYGQRTRPVTYVTVANVSSRPARRSVGSKDTFLERERSLASNSRSAHRESTVEREEPHRAAQHSSSHSRTNHSSSSHTKTSRYVSATEPKRSDSAKSRGTSKSYRTAHDNAAHEHMPPPPDIPPDRPPHEYIEELDLDDETVVPDDSISCVSTDAGRRHPASRSAGSKKTRSSGIVRRRMGVAY